MQRKGIDYREQAGFGLIEVLAAVMVLAIGVLGFVGLQVRAIQASSDAFYRTQAMAIAQDLAERVRINYGQLATYKTTTQWPTTGLTSAPTNCMTGTCSATDMVTFDSQSVRYSAQSLLPQGLVNMESCQGTTSNLSCIYVSWGGLLPTAGAGGQCVNSSGTYQPPSATATKLSPVITCVMLEVM